MATLTAWKFETPEGAAQAEQILVSLAKEQLITIQDAATVEWEAGKKKPKTRQANDLAAAGGLGGAFWGFLFGLLFFVPLLGMAIGAGAGALSGSLADAGIDDDFIDAVKAKVTPGTSALFLLSENAVLDRIHEAFAEGPKAELVHTNLSNDQEAALREAFSED
ncbi:MAG TPA: DUF1269 domain-containing protein [Acidimicrobiales bacterium]|nr:DUF1269 domain-containing protein [Acidimicrobiales bacterium]